RAGRKREGRLRGAAPILRRRVNAQSIGGCLLLRITSDLGRVTALEGTLVGAVSAPLMRGAPITPPAHTTSGWFAMGPAANGVKSAAATSSGTFCRPPTSPHQLHVRSKRPTPPMGTTSDVTSLRLSVTL